LEPTYNHCVSKFYDPNAYNWVAFRNSCAEPLYVSFVTNNPAGTGGGGFDLAPGGQWSIGDTQTDERQNGGYQLYVCPANFVPVDANDKYADRPNVKFRCKRG
jgi:hypothetical protein